MKVSTGFFELLYDIIKVNLIVLVSSFSVNLEGQEVIVKGKASYEDVLARIKKTGKEASF